jgi:hypothetical protein
VMGRTRRRRRCWLLSSWQYVSHLHGPPLFMKAGSSTGRATRREGRCTPAQMTIAIAGEAVRSCKPAAACLGPFGRASEKDGDGSRFPWVAGDKSSPPSLIRGSPQGSSDGTLESFIGLRFGSARGCSNLCLTTQPAQRCSVQRRVMAGT